MVEDLRQGLAERLIQLFVRHAALIRPLSEEGKLKLIQDLTQVTPSSCLLAPRHDNIFPTHSMRSLKLWLPICFRWSDCLPTRSSAHYGPCYLWIRQISLRTTFMRKGLTSDQGMTARARLLTKNYISQKILSRWLTCLRSTVLHHLFARGPPELQLPDSDVQSGLHAANHNASRIYYSHWMDSIAQRARPKADALVGMH